MFESEWAMNYTLKVFACLESQFKTDERKRSYFDQNLELDYLVKLLQGIYQSIYIKNKSFNNEAKKWILKIEYGIRLGQIQSSDLNTSMLSTWLTELQISVFKNLIKVNFAEKIVDIITNHAFLDINMHPEWLIQKGKIRKPVG